MRSARAAAAAKASALPAPADPEPVRSYLGGDGAALVSGQHRAALDLLGSPDRATCVAVLDRLTSLNPDQAAAAAVQAPDPVTAGLLSDERAALARVLTACLHPDRATKAQRKDARQDLTAAAGIVDLRFQALGVTG